MKGSLLFILHPSAFILHPSSLLLRVRVAGLAVEVAEVLGLDEVEPRGGEAREERNYLRVRDRAAARVRDEAAAPVVGAEGLGRAAGVDLDAAVRYRSELQAVARKLRDLRAQLVRRAARPIDVHVDAHCLLVRRLRGARRAPRVRRPFARARL